MSYSLLSGFSFTYVNMWQCQVEEDMRRAGFSDEFAQSAYEYRVNGNEGDEMSVGVDLVKFYNLKLS